MVDRVRNPLYVAYGLIVLAMVVGFYMLATLNEDLERQIKIRQEATCAAYDQLERIIADVVNQSVDSTSTIQEEIDDPDLKALLEQNQLRRQRFRERVNIMLQEAECPRSPAEGES